MLQQDNRLELVLENRHPSFRSVTENEVIGSFYKWEQAFRVFSTIYTDAYPNRAKQLIQYNHIIYSASLTFVWNNVYAYDIDFRLHMSENPDRNWGIILQQAWTLHMKEKLSSFTRLSSNTNVSSGGNSNTGNSGNNNGSMKKVKGKNCWKYNMGKCTYGFNCKFDHRCGICSKFDHGAHICRKGNGNDRTDRHNSPDGKFKDRKR